MFQLDMFGDPPKKKRRKSAEPGSAPKKGKRTKRAKPWTEKTHEERWREFDAKHPEVYKEIRRLAVEDLMANRRRTSIGYLAEQARRNLCTDAKDDQGFMINNSARAIVVRRLIAELPALAPMFELRERRSA